MSGLQMAVKSIFQKYDEDKSGTISWKEFSHIVYDLGYRMDETDIEAVIRELDSHHSGVLSFDDFYAWYTDNKRFQRLDLQNDPKMLDAVQYFRRYDTDNSGKIGLDEYKQLCIDLGQILKTDKDYATGLAALDKNRDGVIDFNEFVDWLRWGI